MCCCAQTRVDVSRSLAGFGGPNWFHLFGRMGQLAQGPFADLVGFVGAWGLQQGCAARFFRAGKVQQINVVQSLVANVTYSNRFSCLGLGFVMQLTSCLVRVEEHVFLSVCWLSFP